ncbi:MULTISPECIES: hypothetical protein [Pseudomonas]|nr:MULTISPECIES: hypothetical protein [Pseudomonas]CAB5622945.1 Uncharacterised protein [Pseudomonas putida]CAB5648502.1 Uncharacterised protein [Pseudomonas putida]CAB5693293.1 Uncharacterised protein [Pseudomonas putida]CAC9676161.1 Uncharacterised protein [Pseudomonas putida]CAC9685291.1 Uncharacterised protein [Pseudomonas putida]
MTWTISDTAGALLLAMTIASTWCVARAKVIAIRRKKENGQCN